MKAEFNNVGVLKITPENLDEERKNILKNIKTYDLTAKADEYNSQTPEFYIDEELCIKGGDWIKYEDLEKALNK